MRKKAHPEGDWRKHQVDRGKGYLLLLLSVLLLSLLGHADRAVYNRVKNLLVENKEISVLHRHDWSGDRDVRSKIMNSWLGPFQPENIYAHIEAVDQKSGQVLFRRLSPALSYVWISDDSGYIVGLSDIRLDNPVQLVIFDRGGRLIKKRKLASWEAELTKDEYEQFVRRFPSTTASLVSRDRIVAVHDRIYIDPQDLGFSGIVGDARDYLVKRKTRSHFSPNFSGSTMNYIFWYKKDDPEIQLRHEAGRLVAISLLDPKGQRFEIPIVEEFCR